MKRPRTILAAIVLFALFCSGCDEIVDGRTPIVLPTYETTATFRFSGGQIQQGQPFTVQSQESIDIDGFLRERGGFSKADIRSAEVVSVRLGRRAPLIVRLNAFENARVSLTAQGSTILVAERASFGNVASENLDVRGGQSVAAVVRAPSFRVMLGFTPVTTTDSDYEMVVEIGLRITVEGI
jgi:hypothetical protein